MTTEKVNSVRQYFATQRPILNLSIVPKPNLALLVNSSQKINTLYEPYQMENAELCSSVPDLSVLIIVHTATYYADRRMNMRSTWANISNYGEYGSIRLLFLVGLTSNTDNVTQNMIIDEFNKYGDLLVGNFNDTYQNLTLKGVMAYKWINERCRNAKFILKIDDDIVVNLYQFFHDIYPKYVSKPRHILCNYIPNHAMQILRDRKSKWYVKETHFKGYSSYPTDYCSGFFVIMTNDLAPSLYESAKITPFFWVDDVYLYGLVPRNIPGVQYVGLEGQWKDLYGQYALPCFQNVTRTCPYLAIGAKQKTVADLWHEILKREALYRT